MRVLDTIGRMLLGASVRRALWRSPKSLVIAAALVGLALMSIGTARAAEFWYATSDEADAACRAWIAANHKTIDPAATGGYCDTNWNRSSFTAYASNAFGSLGMGPHVWRVKQCGPGQHVHPTTGACVTCPADQPWNPETGTCGTPNTCSSEPDKPQSSYFNINAADSSICTGGCKFEALGLLLTSTVDGQTAHEATGGWTPTGAQCSTSGAGVSSPAPADGDGDGTSDGFDGSPNNPGSGGGGGPDGLGQPEDKDCGGPGQPACGENGSGSGNGNSSGGGGNCATPPSSTGDAILAQIAYQAWATRCAVEGLGKGQGGGDGDGEGGQPEWTKGDGPAVEDDPTDYVAESKKFGIGLNPDALLDRENIFGAGSCPVWTFPVFGGGTWSTASLPAWCNTIAPAMRFLVLAMGAFTSVCILLGRFGI